MGWTALSDDVKFWSYIFFKKSEKWNVSFYFYHDCNIWNLSCLLIQNYLEVFEKENKQLPERNFSFNVSTV